MKVKELIEKLNKLNPEMTIVLFDFDNDQFYRISEKHELQANYYLYGIKAVEKPTQFSF